MVAFMTFINKLYIYIYVYVYTIYILCNIYIMFKNENQKNNIEKKNKT